MILKQYHINGLVIYNYVGDKSISPQLEAGYYEPHITHLIKNTKFDSALDIGANIGIHTIKMAQKASVVAIEASTENCKVLKTNLEVNEVDRLVDVRQALILDGRKIEFSRVESNHACSFARTTSYKQDNEIVEVIKSRKLSEVIAGEDHFDFIKMDIEGAELFALEDSPDLFANAKTGVIELNKYCCEKFYNIPIDRLIDKLFDIVGRCYYFSSQNSLAVISRDQLKKAFKQHILLDIVFKN